MAARSMAFCNSPDVSRPRVASQPGARVVGQFERRFAKLPPEPFEEMLREQHHVFSAVAQRRNCDRHGGNTEIEVLAKSLVGDGRAQILVRGGEDADVHVDGLRSADALEAPFLEHAQQLSLNRRRQVADFVEEKCSAMRQLDFADLPRSRARVGSALVTE